MAAAVIELCLHFYDDDDDGGGGGGGIAGLVAFDISNDCHSDHRSTRFSQALCHFSCSRKIVHAVKSPPASSSFVDLSAPSSDLPIRKRSASGAWWTNPAITDKATLLMCSLFHTAGRFSNSYVVAEKEVLAFLSVSGIPRHGTPHHALRVQVEEGVRSRGGASRAKPKPPRAKPTPRHLNRSVSPPGLACAARCS